MISQNLCCVVCCEFWAPLMTTGVVKEKGIRMSWARWTEHFPCQRNCMCAQNFFLTTLSSWGLGHVTTGASCPWIAMFLSLLQPLIFFFFLNIHSYLLFCHFKFVLTCQNRTVRDCADQYVAWRPVSTKRAHVAVFICQSETYSRPLFSFAIL